MSTAQNSSVLTKLESCYSAFKPNMQFRNEVREGRVPRCVVARHRRASADSWRVTDARAGVGLVATERMANRAETPIRGVCTSYKYHWWVALGEGLVLIIFGPTGDSGSRIIRFGGVNMKSAIWHDSSQLVFLPSILMLSSQLHLHVWNGLSERVPGPS